MTMSNRKKELLNELRRIGAIPYRRFGKVKIAYIKELVEDDDPVKLSKKKKQLDEAINSVEVCTRLSKIMWDQPTMDEMVAWQKHGMKVVEVCDDPIPADIDLETVSPNWILEQCRRYNFKLTVVDGKLTPVADEGYKFDDCKKGLPSWMMPACNKRKQELIEAAR